MTPDLERALRIWAQAYKTRKDEPNPMQPSRRALEKAEAELLLALEQDGVTPRDHAQL